MAAASAAMAATAAGMASAPKPWSVLSASIMRRVARVAAFVVGRIGLETVERLLSACRKWSVVAVMRIVAVVYMAIKPVRTVIPGAGPDEHPAGEPIGPIVAIRCTIIGRIGEVAIGAHRRDTDVDRNLCRRSRKGAEHARSKNKQCKKLQMTHLFLL
jgi:hypothetical protein